MQHALMRHPAQLREHMQWVNGPGLAPVHLLLVDMPGSAQFPWYQGTKLLRGSLGRHLYTPSGHHCNWQFLLCGYCL
jgi:hypothetical protein